ncbi:hypothetical protein AB0H12_25660 [Actinosynnema sp. NPDC023794]
MAEPVRDWVGAHVFRRGDQDLLVTRETAPLCEEPTRTGQVGGWSQGDHEAVARRRAEGERLAEWDRRDRRDDPRDQTRRLWAHASSDPADLTRTDGLAAWWLSIRGPALRAPAVQPPRPPAATEARPASPAARTLSELPDHQDEVAPL